MRSNRGPLEVVGLDAPLRGGSLGDPDHATVLADLDAELHRLPLGIPAGVLGGRR
jgi:hypothetical protein